MSQKVAKRVHLLWKCPISRRLHFLGRTQKYCVPGWSGLVALRGHGKVRPHHIQILFTVFSKANQVRLDVANGGGSTQYSGGTWRSIIQAIQQSVARLLKASSLSSTWAPWGRPRLELIYSENQHRGNTHPVYDQAHPMSCSC